MLLLIIGIGIGFVSCYVVSKIVGNVKITTYLTEVENTGKKTSSDSNYWLLADGEDKYLFTGEQLKTAKNRALKNPEDI